MLVTKLYGESSELFHKKYPNAVIVESSPITADISMFEMVKWSRENISDDALVTWKAPYKTLIWYCSSEEDAMAVKLKWT